MLKLFNRALPDDPDLRLMAFSTIVNTIGMGLFLSSGTIFLVRSAGLTPSEAGLGITIGALVGLCAGPWIGDAADRLGAREVVIICMFLEAIASASLLLVHIVPVLAVVTALAATGRAGTGSARGALIGMLAKGGHGATLRTHLRALTNLGLAVGTLGATVGLAIDTRSAYATMILVDTATFLFAAGILARLPRSAPTRPAQRSGGSELHHRRWGVLQDRRYLALTAVTSVASVQYYVLIYAVPVWVTLHTDVPRWLAAVLFFVSAVIVASIQVPATRSIRNPRSAARLLALSGPLFIVAWTLIALASGPTTAVAVVLLVIGIVIHSLAEVWQAGGTFELSFSLAREEAHGQYQGVFGFGHNVVQALSPVVVISTCVIWGKPGWIVLAIIVALAGVASLFVERMAPPVASRSPER